MRGMRLRSSLSVCFPYLTAIQCYSLVQYEQPVIGHSFFVYPRQVSSLPRS